MICASKLSCLYLQFFLMLVVMVATAHAHDYVSHRHAAATFRTVENEAVALDMMLTLKSINKNAKLFLRV